MKQWERGGVQGRFFSVVSPIYGLFSLVLVVVCWRMPKRQRTWALLAGLSGIVVVVSSAGLSDEQITALVIQFKTWHWLRAAVLIGGWVMGLRALSLSSSEERRLT